MRCAMGRQAETVPGRATLTFERDGATLVIKVVPARVCPNCGEEYVDERTAARLLQEADVAARAGVQVDVREYVAA